MKILTIEKTSSLKYIIQVEINSTVTYFLGEFYDKQDEEEWFLRYWKSPKDLEVHRCPHCLIRGVDIFMSLSFRSDYGFYVDFWLDTADHFCVR